MIKPTKLVIHNIGKIADSTIEINKPLILFYGEIKQGKSTILNCVRWVCGGEFPADIIRHGEDEGSIELRIDGGMIGRSFYRAKDKSAKSRPVTFIKGGRPVQSPVAEIKRFLNPFLIDQDFLRNKNELERKRYFVELFAVDTTELDTELYNSTRDAQNLRAKIAGYGDIDLTPVESVDVSSLSNQLAVINARNQELAAKRATDLKAFYDRSNFRQSKTDEIARIANEVREMEKRLEGFRVAHKLAKEALEANPPLPEPASPPFEDTESIECQLREAGAQNVRAEQYKKDKARAEQKEADEKRLQAMEKRQREIKAEKQAKLKDISAKSGVEGLEFDADGNFIYEGTTAGMISDSQLMKLSSALSSLYPDGFGLDLLDRAESLGKSIFEYVDRAKAEKKTIMATIVGERPAKVPPEIGVFVVEDGKVNP
jgi:AAA domain